MVQLGASVAGVLEWLVDRRPRQALGALLAVVFAGLAVFGGGGRVTSSSDGPSRTQAAAATASKAAAKTRLFVNLGSSGDEHRGIVPSSRARPRRRPFHRPSACRNAPKRKGGPLSCTRSSSTHPLPKTQVPALYFYLVLIALALIYAAAQVLRAEGPGQRALRRDRRGGALERKFARHRAHRRGQGHARGHDPIGPLPIYSYGVMLGRRSSAGT